MGRSRRFAFGLIFVTAAVPMLAVRAAEPDRGIAGFSELSADADWPWWRGPQRNGWAAEKLHFPMRWSASENVVWKAALPGRGHASPIIVGNQVVLATADTSKQRQSVLALDRQTGALRWETQISQGGFPAQNHPKNSEATPTLASDGERLFATFFHHEKIQLTALSFQGKILWQQDLGPFNPQRYKYGYASSPLMYRNTVIVSAEHDGESFITARDRQTGAQVWRTPRPNNITFSSPVVAHVASRDQLLLSGSEMVAAYDPDNGRQLWTAPGTTAATCGTMVWEGDLVVASGGYPKAETLAIRADGSGTVVWTNPQKCYEQSMLAYQGHVYAFTDNGVMYCWRIGDGKEMWKHRLKGPVSSSPILAGGHIYWANEEGNWYVFKPNPSKFELVAENKLLDEAFASPAAVAKVEAGAEDVPRSTTDGRLFIRTATGTGAARKEFLFCIGE